MGLLAEREKPVRSKDSESLRSLKQGIVSEVIPHFGDIL